jgi:hypothetical protein
MHCGAGVEQGRVVGGRRGRDCLWSLRTISIFAPDTHPPALGGVSRGQTAIPSFDARHSLSGVQQCRPGVAPPMMVSAGQQAFGGKRGSSRGLLSLQRRDDMHSPAAGPPPSSCCPLLTCLISGLASRARESQQQSAARWRFHQRSVQPPTASLAGRQQGLAANAMRRCPTLSRPAGSAGASARCDSQRDVHGC